MRNPGKILSVITLIVFLLPGITFGQSFGKNKVQYNYFRWKYLTSEHFNIYYNSDSRAVADFAAEVAEDAYLKMSQSLRYTPESRDPITLITYQSHNDFVQTNVTFEQPEEGVGGFTEFLKTRVVVPFEGDHEKFRHVISHELTHAIMLNLLYGQGFGAIISGMSQSRLPLWFVEGLSEYMSRNGLDFETEMFLRDAVVNDMLPEINQLGEIGYLGIYKCGQSILYYIAYRYGDEKIGEILHQVKGLRDFDRALRASIGIDTEELSKRWRRWLKERYWPQVSQMDPPDKGATRLTNHKKEYCYVNNSPALSPNGEWLAFLSDRSDYFDVYLMHTFDGKVEKRLVHGQRSGQFEELHWLRPGITWSPDGTRIALAAKAGKSDAIFIVDVKKAKVVRRFQFKSDGLFSPSWSPDGDEIAFVYVANGQSDIAILDIKTGDVRKITDDLFDDDDPSWSPDGKRLLFTSNRGSAVLSDTSAPPKTLFGWQIDKFDVFQIDLLSSEILRLTYDDKVARTPLWTNEDYTILYVSNVSGAFNLYTHNLLDDIRRPITNVVTGAFQPTLSRDDKTLAYASYYENGYDIYMMSNPLAKTDIRAHIVPEAEKIIQQSLDTAEVAGVPSANYGSFVFDRLMRPDQKTIPAKIDSIQLSTRSRNEDGGWQSHDYRVQLSPDIAFVAASYNPYFRAQGSATILFSDVLGNHHLYLAADVNRSTENSNFFTMYQYLARRMDIGIGFYHYAYPFNYGYWRDRNYGLFLSTSYPLSRYNRLEFSSEYIAIERSAWSDYKDDYARYDHRTAVVPHVGYVHDTSVWHVSTEPGNGRRWRVDLSLSPPIYDSDKNVEFTTGSFDWRNYLNYKKDFSLALRFSGAVSGGSNSQRFFLGGVGNWFNARFDNPENRILVNNIEDIYFSSFVGPLRGVGYYNQIGTRYILNNVEFRFPFIRHLMFGFPLPAYFRNIRGAFFTDWGAAWSGSNLNRVNTFPDGILPHKSLFGFGTGIRIDLGIFPIQWDIAWSPHNTSQKMVPQYYFSINTGF